MQGREMEIRMCAKRNKRVICKTQQVNGKSKNKREKGPPCVI